MVDGVKTETIEVSLETMEVVQCCGKCNLNSPYHDEILRVMNKNIHLIAKRMCGWFVSDMILHNEESNYVILLRNYFLT